MTTDTKIQQYIQHSSQGVSLEGQPITEVVVVVRESKEVGCVIDTIAYIPREEEQDQEEYPLTIEHVKQFLATKGEHDSLGNCFCATDCLLSYTLDWLYPERKHWRVDLCDYSSARHGIYDGLLDPACYFLRCAFDQCGRDGKIQVTKTRMRAYLESIVMDKGGRIGETEIPFDIDDLFGE